MIRLLAFDLDGTALFHHGELSPANRAALEAAADRGIWIVPATGRLNTFLPPSVEALRGLRYVLTSNGAAVYDRRTGEAVVSELLSTDAAAGLMALLEESGVYYEVYIHGEAYTVRDHLRITMDVLHFPESKRFVLQKPYAAEVDNLREFVLRERLCPEKLSVPLIEPVLREKLQRALTATGLGDVTSSLPNNLEIGAKGVNKGRGLSLLCQKLGVAPQEVMALGDSENDLAMLRFAGVSVAMGNAGAAVAAQARFVTSRCEEDGLAQAVRHFVLEA